MSRAHWPLLLGQPIIEVNLTFAQGGQTVTRRLLADTGAGSANSGFEMLIDEQDCLLCGGRPTQPIILGGAYSGSFPTYLLRVKIPMLGFDRFLPVVGISQNPQGLDGIACFQFLNRFTYGNFGDPRQFGLEV
jgi:hypothetical protein